MCPEVDDVICKGQPPRAQIWLAKRRERESSENPKGKWEIYPSTELRGIPLFGGLVDDEELHRERKEGACEVEEESRKRHPSK